jgi:hypothetical protein
MGQNTIMNDEPERMLKERVIFCFIPAQLINGECFQEQHTYSAKILLVNQPHHSGVLLFKINVANCPRGLFNSYLSHCENFKFSLITEARSSIFET